MEIPQFIQEYRAADAKRISNDNLPERIRQINDVQYADYGERGLLDVYYPEGTVKALPTILCMHGGGYAHGSKEANRAYSMCFAAKGFTVVNFNYRLAPEFGYPAQVQDVNVVAQWACEHADEYFIDTQNVFLLGNSSAAQVMSQYAAAWSNSAYAELLEIEVPSYRIGAVSFISGGYRLGEDFEIPDNRPGHYYFGAHPMEHFGETLDLRVHILPSYPPTFITTAVQDFQREFAARLGAELVKSGVETVFHIYDNADHSLGHCFNAMNLAAPEAVACNNDHAEFFMKHCTHERSGK